MSLSIEEFFQEANTKDRKDVKSYIIRHNLIPYKCNTCGNVGEWFGKPMSLELHHINGINNDNRLENLTFLCPNCHAITENYGNKKIKHQMKKYYCPLCSSEMNRNSSMCGTCKNLLQQKFEVSREELKSKIRHLSWRELGRQYNVSDTAIKKRCKNLGLPNTTKEIKSYSDEEWEKL